MKTNNSVKNILVAAGFLAVAGAIYFASKAPSFHVDVDNSKKQVTIRFKGITKQYNWPMSSGNDTLQFKNYSLQIESLPTPGFHIRLVKDGTKIIKQKSIQF